MKKRELEISHRGRTIYGSFYEPEKAEYPLLIMSHGYNGHASDFDKSAKLFADQGVGTVCYTFCGGSTRDKSGFPTTEMTLYTEMEDLCAVLDEVKQWLQVRKDAIYLFGGSQGGMVSAMVAASRSQEVKGLILMYPAFCIPDDWRTRYREEEIPEQIDFWGMELGGGYFRTAREIQLEEILAGYRGPVLLLHGTDDEIVPLSYSEKAAAAYDAAKLVVLDGERHGFTEAGTRRMEQETLQFISGV